MADGIPTNFRKTPENLSINFSYTDFVNSTGYVSFYPMDLEDGGSSDLILSPQIYYSAAGFGNVVALGGNVNDDFDILINKSVTLRGDAIITIPVMYYRSGAGTGSHSFNCTARIIHYDGSTETEIGSTTYSQSSGTLGSGGVIEKIWVVKINLPQTTIPAGDYIRVSFDITGLGNGLNCYYGRDPANRTTLLGPAITSGAWTISQSKVDLPFRIDV